MGFPRTSQTALLPSSQKSQEVSFIVQLLKLLSLWICDVCVIRILLLCVCVYSHGLPVWSEKGCQGGESTLFAHVQTHRMDEDRDGISLWWTFSSYLASQCLERHGNPSWNGQASYWMREDLELLPSRVWMGCRRQAVKVVCVFWGWRGSLLRWGQYNVNGPCCHQLFSPFQLCPWKHVLATN